MNTEEQVRQANVIQEVILERQRQDEKWGEQNHPNGTGDISWLARADAMKATVNELAEKGKLDWMAILLEELYEAFSEDEPLKLRDELIQCAAVIIAWVEKIDRQGE